MTDYSEYGYDQETYSSPDAAPKESAYERTLNSIWFDLRTRAVALGASSSRVGKARDAFNGEVQSLAQLKKSQKAEDKEKYKQILNETAANLLKHVA